MCVGVAWGGYDAMREGWVVGRGTGGSRLRGNDVDVCGNDVMVVGMARCVRE